MLVEKEITMDDETTIGYTTAIFDSSSILKTIYFPQTNKLYISYKRGGTYSYGGVDNETYEKFELSESQGKFIANEFKKNPKKYPYLKEFTLTEGEIKDLNSKIEDKTTNKDII